MKAFDFIVLGSGFGGSLLSTLLSKAGCSVALIDQTRHPRFAIGESSTPLADATLARIADDFDLPEIRPLAKYGVWKRTHPTITCGLKRGFSYFGHHPHQTVSADEQMLVTASACDEYSDTHWLRSDVDQFFFGIAKKTRCTNI